MASSQRLSGLSAPSEPVAPRRWAPRTVRLRLAPCRNCASIRLGSSLGPGLLALVRHRLRARYQHWAVTPCQKAPESTSPVPRGRGGTLLGPALGQFVVLSRDWHCQCSRVTLAGRRTAARPVGAIYLSSGC